MNLLPNYDPEAVRPMRDELTSVGFSELMSPEEVDAAIGQAAAGTSLFVINSVCGCAAGNARPGVAAALQNARIPDRLWTAFAGMEKSAVARLREYLAPNAPSSPSFALFKDGKLIRMWHRYEIENSSAADIAESLIEAFDQHCSKSGPSVPREHFQALEFIKRCGSSLPLFRG